MNSLNEITGILPPDFRVCLRDQAAFLFFGSNIGPALVALFFGNSAPIADLWVFIVGPLAGAALAAVCYKYLESPDAAKK